MKRLLVFCLAFITLFVSTSSKKPEKSNEPEKSNFTGIISYYGKVTRIPDKSKTRAKLNDFEAQFQLYMNDEYTKRVEDYKSLGLSIIITEGLKNDLYMQQISSREGNFLAIATLQEMKDYQLTSRYVKYNSLKMRKVTGKKRIQGYVCNKAICDIVTEDNIRIQLIAWYTTELYIEDYHIPYFPDLKGIPLAYDTYNGQHVVTYTATDVKKMPISNSYFSKPGQIEPMTYTEFMQKMQELGNKQEE
jgi:GLPGLI family protein